MNYLAKNLSAVLFFYIATVLTSNNAYASDPTAKFQQAMTEYKGKVVYLDFWASWCVPCRKSFPWMNAIQAQYQQQGLVVLSVNLDAQKTLAEKFLLEIPAEFAIIYDAKGVLAKEFQLKGMPSSYLFNREGKLISAHSGFNAKKQKKYEQEIIQALKN